jgi:hypothetical protein
MARKARAEVQPEVLEIDGIPTAAGLARLGLAQRRTDRHGRAYIRVSDEGHRLIGEAMRRRVAEDRRRGAEHTVKGKVYPDE